MIVNGDLANLQHFRYLAVFQSLLIAQTENLLRELRQLSVDVVVKHLQLFLFCSLFWCNHLYHDGLLHLLFFLPVHQQIDTTIADARQQIGLERFCSEIGAAVEQMGKHIAHHILAFCVIAKHTHGQSEHPVVMTSENRFEFPFVCHLFLAVFSLNTIEPSDFLSKGTTFFELSLLLSRKMLTFAQNKEVLSGMI